jgi:electron transport complex protein RnfA
MTYIGMLIYFVFLENTLLSFGFGADFGLRVNWSIRSIVVLIGSLAGLLVIVGSLGWMVLNWVLYPLDIQELSMLIFLPGVASLMLLQSRFLDKLPRIFRYPQSFAVLVFGFLLILQYQKLSYIETLIGAASASIGLGVINLFLHALRDRMRLERLPVSVVGIPAELIATGLLGIIFSIFDTLILMPILR